jgi:hypothetical protein
MENSSFAPTKARKMPISASKLQPLAKTNQINQINKNALLHGILFPYFSSRYI